MAATGLFVATPGAMWRGAKRYLIAGLFVVLVVGALAAIKGAQIATLMGFGEDKAREGPPPEAVGVATAISEDWVQKLAAVGTVASGYDVAVRTELAGVVTRIAFESGDEVRRGDLLVQLDVAVERADLAAAETDEGLARVTAERAGTLAARGVASLEERDRALSGFRAADARVASLGAAIAKKTIRAPIAGRVGIRAVNVGDYVAAGAHITELGSTAGVFVDFTLPQEQVSEVVPGLPVALRFGDQVFTGAISAVDPSAQSSTRAVGLRATVLGDTGPLRPGMFVNVDVELPRRETLVVVPLTAIIHASYGDSVFVLEERREGATRTPDGQQIFEARQTFVRTGEARGDFVALLDGVQQGQRVVTAGGFKLRNGSPVVVTDRGIPEPELDPHPVSK